MRLEISILRYEFIFACTIWTLWEKEVSFCNVLLMCKKHYIHYTSSILVKIMDLVQLFFHMLTLKAPVQLVTNRYGSNLNVSMN